MAGTSCYFRGEGNSEVRIKIMNGTKRFALALMSAGIVGVALSATAQDDLSLVDTSKKTPNKSQILSVARMKLGDPKLINLMTLTGDSMAPAGSPFSISYPTNGTAQISWNLADEGMDLKGVYISGAKKGANLYKVIDPADMISGSATINTPLAGKSGQFLGISQMVFLGAPAPAAVPEPSSVILLGLGAAGFFGWCIRRA
jgi:PEP-CTERM motif